QRLFFSCKHMMSGSCSSMQASTAAATVGTVKEFLKAGFGEGIDYLEDVTI
ncbi:hypothetical protein GGX14DRAFT_304548, partial [Mycena pura]